mgnify:CR=1 FL=1
MAKVIIYSRDYCPYCTNAIRLLKSKSVDYVLIDITDNPEKRSENCGSFVFNVLANANIDPSFLKSDEYLVVGKQF